MNSLKSDIQNTLQLMDQSFEGLFTWLRDQYDSTTGGFFYARSSKENAEFQPDIESTAQAINILLRNGLLEKLPIKMKEQLIQFFQRKQDPETGYFYDENPAMKNCEVSVHRAINYSVGSLRKLGSQPLYPLPLQSKAAPSYVQSPESYLEKWKSIDLRNSWRGCDLLATSCVYIGEMPKEKQAVFIQQAVDYLQSIQDPKTGLWGEGSMYVRISGTFKLHTFYSRYQIPMPNQERIYKSILKCLRTEEAVDMCYIRNPINLLSYLTIEIPIQELAEIIEITLRNMKRLKRPDGGFSRELDHSPPAPNIAQVKAGEYYPDMPEPIYLGKGLVEGDMNASTQATLIRIQCYELAGVERPSLAAASEFFLTQPL